MISESNNVLLEKVGVAEAPSKDYGQLIVTKTQIIFRLWRITARIADAIKLRPKQWLDSYADFVYDESLHREIYRFFGPHVLEEVKNFAIGGNGLLRVPENALLKIASYLTLLDIKRLGLVCRHLNTFCNSDYLWHYLFKRHYSTYPVIPEALVKVAGKQGWKKVFFTNKLQLQVQLRKEQRGLDSGRSSNAASYFSVSDDGSASKASNYAESPKPVHELDGISFDGRHSGMISPLISDKDSIAEHEDRVFDPVEPKYPTQEELLGSDGRWSTLMSANEEFTPQDPTNLIRPSSTPAANLRDSWNNSA